MTRLRDAMGWLIVLFAGMFAGLAAPPLHAQSNPPVTTPVHAPQQGGWYEVFQANLVASNRVGEWNPARPIYLATTMIEDGYRVSIRPRVYEAATGEILYTLPESERDWRWSPNGDDLLTWYDADFSIEVRTLADSEWVMRWQAHDTAIENVYWSADGQMVLSRSDDGTLKVWTRDGELVAQRDQAGARYTEEPAWSPDGRYIVYDDSDDTAHVWSLLDPDQPDLVFHNAIGGLAWSPDSRYLAVGVDYTRVQVWDITRQERVNTFRTPEGPIYYVEWHPDGNHVATFGLDASAWRVSPLTIWEVATGQPLAEFELRDFPVRIGWNATGDQFIVADIPRYQVWDRLGQTLRFELAAPSFPPISFSPEADYFAAACPSGTGTCLWNTAVNRLEAELQSDGVGVLTWSYDGRYLAGSDDKGRLRIWTKRSG